MALPRSITRTTISLAALVALLFVLLPPAVVGAAENQDLGVSPTVVVEGQERPFFNFFVSPGTEVRDSVSLINKTDRDITLDLYVSDAIATSDGGFALKKADDPKDGVASWVTLPTGLVTVPPMTEVKIPFVITVPADVTPGDHIGGIVALDTAELPTSTEGDTNLAVRNGVAARIYARVNGPLSPTLSVTDVSVSKDTTVGSLFGLSSTAQVSYTVVNSGNVRLSAEAVVAATATIGGGATLDPEVLPELVPGASVTIERSLGDVSSLGNLTVKVGVTSADPTPIATGGQASVLSIPWLLILVLIIVVVGAVYAIKRRSNDRPAPPAPSREGELVDA